MHIKTPLKWDIQQNNESLIVQLSGELTRDTLLPLWQQRAIFLSPKANQHIYWDLKSLTNIDSSGFTLLSELLHYYQKQNRNSLINVPDMLPKLADLFGLSAWYQPFYTKSNL